MVSLYFNDSIADLMRHVAREYVYGHHKDKVSLLASIREGCVICNILSCPAGEEYPHLGYFSVFYVTFDVTPVPQSTGDEPYITMWIHVGGDEKRFLFSALGKRHFAIIPR